MLLCSAPGVLAHAVGGWWVAENHRDANFPYLSREVLAGLPALFKSATGTPFVFPATGTGAWEAALTNTLSPGDRVLAARHRFMDGWGLSLLLFLLPSPCFPSLRIFPVPSLQVRFGQFSHLWVDQAQRLGLDVVVQDEEWGRGVDEARVGAALAADTGHTIKAVMIVHNETTTGVTSDVGAVRAAMDAARHPALLLVDGVSSIGACDFRMDDWRVDVALTGSQKALSLPTGLGLCCASPKALAASKTARLPRVFFSFDDMAKFNATGGFPYTPSIPLLYGLREALRALGEEGLDAAIGRHTRFADATRAAVAAWGLQLLCAHPRWSSNSLTVVKAPAGVDTNALVRLAFAKYNLSIGVGLARLSGSVFRIGHIGDMDAVSLLGALAGVEMALRDCGYTGFQPGAGVGAALVHLQKTAQVIPTRSLDPM